MATDSMSPVARSELRNQRFLAERNNRFKNKLLPWCTTLFLLCFEIFALKGTFGSFLLGFLSSTLVVWIEYALLTYVLMMVAWILCVILFPSSRPLTRPATDVASPVVFHEKSFCMQSTPIRSHGNLDNSWVEDINFGGSPAPLNTSGSARQSSFPASPASDVISSVISSSRSKSSPYSKPVDSIHTREQLERLLKKDSESSFIDVSSSSLKNSSFSFFNILDLSSGERKGYQLSEKAPQESKENTSAVAQFDSNGRVHLSPIGTADGDTDEMSKLKSALQAAKVPRKLSGSPMLRRTDSAMDRRRRSHSSPERQLSSSVLVAGETEASGDLDELALARGEYKLRAWIVNTILKPLREQIAKVNVQLDKEHANPPLRVGVTSVEALKTALATRDSLRNTLLPYIVRYLSVNSNQAYVVSRISELCSDTFMTAYNWNSGGSEPVDERSPVARRVSRKSWHEGLPTDADLVFTLFSTYMDSLMTSNPLVGSISLDQPFTALFTLKAPNKPGAALCASGSVYMHMTSSNPPNFELVSVAEGTRLAMKTVVAKGASNLFYTILQFIHRAKTANGGKIDMMSIGRTGLGIASVLD